MANNASINHLQTLGTSPPPSFLLLLQRLQTPSTGCMNGRPFLVLVSNRLDLCLVDYIHRRRPQLVSTQQIYIQITQPLKKKQLSLIKL